MNIILTPNRPHFPGALTCEAAALMCHIQQTNIWIPEYRAMSKAQIDGLAQLIGAGYVQSTAWWGYRACGRKQVEVATTTPETRIRAAFVSLGIEGGNIKSVTKAPNGFAARSNRWCITLHHSVRLSAVRVNTTPGISGAIANGNVWFILVGKEG